MLIVAFALEPPWSLPVQPGTSASRTSTAGRTCSDSNAPARPSLHRKLPVEHGVDRADPCGPIAADLVHHEADRQRIVAHGRRISPRTRAPLGLFAQVLKCGQSSVQCSFRGWPRAVAGPSAAARPSRLARWADAVERGVRARAQGTSLRLNALGLCGRLMPCTSAATAAGGRHQYADQGGHIICDHGQHQRHQQAQRPSSPTTAGCTVGRLRREPAASGEALGFFAGTDFHDSHDDRRDVVRPAAQIGHVHQRPHRFARRQARPAARRSPRPSPGRSGHRCTTETCRPTSSGNGPSRSTCTSACGPSERVMMFLGMKLGHVAARHLPGRHHLPHQAVIERELFELACRAGDRRGCRPRARRSPRRGSSTSALHVVPMPWNSALAWPRS